LFDVIFILHEIEQAQELQTWIWDRHVSLQINAKKHDDIQLQRHNWYLILKLSMEKRQVTWFVDVKFRKGHWSEESNGMIRLQKMKKVRNSTFEDSTF
jgi:hypothetical protein